MSQITLLNQQQLLEQYFNGQLQIKDLTEAEYQFYSDNLIEVDEVETKAEFLFFESGSAYFFCKGTSLKTYNVKKQRIKVDYGIEGLKRIYVGDNLLDYLRENHHPEYYFYTNIDAHTSLFKVIKKEVGLLLPILTVIDYPTVFRDLCGIIEVKANDNLAKDKFFSSIIAKQTFADSLRDIDDKTQYYPPMLKSLFHLFHILSY